MASIIKDIKQATASTLSAGVAVVTSTADVVTKVAGSTTAIVDPTIGMVTDVASVGRSYTSTLLLETRADSEIANAIAQSKLEASKTYLESKAGKSKLAEASEKYVQMQLDEMLDF